MNIIDFMNGFHSECENDATNDKLPTARQFGLQYPELRKAKVKITVIVVLAKIRFRSLFTSGCERLGARNSSGDFILHTKGNA